MKQEAGKQSESMPIVQVEHLTTGYGEKLIVKDISFEVRRGEVFVILGGSGSGKSTVMKHMIGLYRPMSGKILIDGHDIVAAEGLERLQILKKFGVLFQNGALFGSMTVLDNMRLPLEEYTELPDEAMDLIAMMKLQLVGLEGVGNSMPAQLSGGMQRRAALARAMVLDPQILFLDEPSGGLDPIISAELDHLILRLAHSLDITFVIVSHELSSIYTIADRVIILEKESGKIIASGDPKELKEHSDNHYVRHFLNREVSGDAVFPSPTRSG